MSTALQILIGVLTTVVAAAILSLVRLAYKRLKGFHGEHTSLVDHLHEYEKHRKETERLWEIQKAQNAALREILGDILDKEHARFVANGYASPAEKASFERKYNAYHALGGNGTRTALYEDTLQMNSYAS